MKNNIKVYRLVEPAIYTFSIKYLNTSELERKLSHDCIYLSKSEYKEFSEMLDFIYDMYEIFDEYDNYSLIIDLFWDLYNKKLNIEIEINIELLNKFLSKLKNDNIRLNNLFNSVISIVDYNFASSIDGKNSYISSIYDPLELITFLSIREYLYDYKYKNYLFLEMNYDKNIAYSDGEVRFNVTNLIKEGIEKITNIISSIVKNDILTFKDILENYQNDFLQIYLDKFTSEDVETSKMKFNDNINEINRIFQLYEIDFIYKFFGIDSELDIENPDVFYDLGLCIIHIYGIIHQN